MSECIENSKQIFPIVRYCPEPVYYLDILISPLTFKSKPYFFSVPGFYLLTGKEGSSSALDTNSFPEVSKYYPINLDVKTKEFLN